MENAVTRRLQSIHFGEAQRYRNITLLPILSRADGAFQYRTMGEALAKWEVVATEVSAVGSVNELKAVNRGNRSVLLLNGEELNGARRNRVLNASLLIKEMSETRIPVSCTEQARWSYTSKAFHESGILMAYAGRARLTDSVHRSLARSGSFRVRQTEVWDEIARLRVKASTPAAAFSLNKIFRGREDELRHCDEVFVPLPQQVGLLAMIDGEPVGMDVVSLKSAYSRLHPKLIRSYAFEALLDFRADGQSFGKAHTLALVQSFLAQAMAAVERPFSSVGHGTDFRYRLAAPKVHVGRLPLRSSAFNFQPSLIGSALVHKDEVIHATFFRFPKHGQDSCLASRR
jgi:hypothetical protein